MADKSGTIQSSSYSIARTDVYWEATAGTGGCTVKATLKAVNTGGYYLQMTNYGTAYLTIDGEKKTTTGNAYSASSNGTANFLTFSKWISYTGNKNITIEGYIPANYMTNGTKVSDSKASATIALPKVGSAPTLTEMTAPTTQVISETASTITVTWEKATSYNNSCTYGIGVSINGGAYSWVYPDNNIDTTSYTYTVSNKTQGTTYKFAVVAANDVAQSNIIESGTVTLNKLEPPTIGTLNTYNPYVASSLSVPLSGGSQLNGSTFYRCAALYYGDEQLVVVVPTSKNNTSVSLTYSTDNYLTKLGKTKYSDTFKVVAWSQNDNGSKSSLVTQTFTANINTDDGATPTLGTPTLSGGALSNPATCFIKGISTLTITSATGAARRAPSGVTLSYSIRVSGSYSQGGQSASWSDLSAGTKIITVTCTDSRGLSTSVTKQCVIQDYAPPTIKSLTVARLDNPNTSAKAVYELYYSPIYQYTDVNTKGNQLNGINSQQYRLNEGAWGNYTSGTEIKNLSVDTLYKFQLRCADKVNTSKYTTSSQYTIYTITHELSLRKGRLGINCVPQAGYALDVKGKARFTDGIESPVNTSSYLNGSKGTNVLVNSTATGANYKTFLSGASTNGRFSLSMYQDRVMVGYQAQSSIDESTNALTKSINLLQEDGTSVFNTIRCADGLRVGSTFDAGVGKIAGVALKNTGAIELSNDKPYIDFHYNYSSSNYTHRIIDEGSYLSIYGDFRVVNDIRLDSNMWAGNVYIPGITSEWIGFYKSDRRTRYCWIGRNGSSNTKFYFNAEDNITQFYFNKPIYAPNLDDSGWVDCVLNSRFARYSADYPTLQVRKVGKVVYMRGILRNNTTLKGGDMNIDVATIPEGYIPSYRMSAVMQGSGSNRFAYMVYATGELRMDRYSNNTTVNSVSPNSWLHFCGSWLLD